VSVTIEEVYNEQWADRNSDQFKTLAKAISTDIVSMYDNAYRNQNGRFMVNILSLE